MSRLARVIGDKVLLKLIRRFLKAGMMVNGVVIERQAGTPQGEPLSPLLSNIMLNELDWELESRGHTFCRYALMKLGVSRKNAWQLAKSDKCWWRKSHNPIINTAMPKGWFDTLGLFSLYNKAKALKA